MHETRTIPAVATLFYLVLVYTPPCLGLENKSGVSREEGALQKGAYE